MKIRAVVLSVILSAPALPLWAAAASTPSLTSEKEKLSYSIGMDIGQNFKQQKFDIDTAAFQEGFKATLADAKTVLSTEEAKTILTDFQQKLLTEREQQLKQLAEANLQKGKQFLDSNAKKTNIVSLPSGLQYRVIQEGKGTSPALSDIVTTHYRGHLIDGTEFDSSYKRGEPVSFPVQGVIPGWSEALQHMKPGAKWELFIPAALAYGETGAGRLIGPNETLVFEVELLKIATKEEEEN